MSYTITIKKSAAKVIEMLPNKTALVITNAILALTNNPRPLGCKKLKGKHAEYWRIRSGTTGLFMILMMKYGF